VSGIPQPNNLAARRDSHAANRHTDGPGGNQRSFDHRVRVQQQDGAVLQSFDTPRYKDQLEMPPEIRDPIVNGLTRVTNAYRQRNPGVTYPSNFYHTTTGETLFFRRQGPMDFACATCHGDTGKRIRLQALPYLSKPEEARTVVGEWPAYRVSQGTVMTMQHRIADCYWQMRLPLIDYGSDVTVALTMYLVNQAKGGAISAPAIKR
jgi:hypothetical protein